MQTLLRIPIFLAFKVHSFHQILKEIVNSQRMKAQYISKVTTFFFDDAVV